MPLYHRPSSTDTATWKLDLTGAGMETYAQKADRNMLIHRHDEVLQPSGLERGHTGTFGVVHETSPAIGKLPPDLRNDKIAA